MAAYIQIPRDLTRVRTKLAFGLTKRQLICFGTAAAIGIPSYLGLRNIGNTSIAMMLMMVIMMPVFLLAMYEKNGQPLEVIIRQFIEARFIRPAVRPYRTENYYSALSRQYDLDREVEAIVNKAHFRNRGKAKKERERRSRERRNGSGAEETSCRGKKKS